MIKPNIAKLILAATAFTVSVAIADGQGHHHQFAKDVA